MAIKPKVYSELEDDKDDIAEKSLRAIHEKQCLYDIYKETYTKMYEVKNKYLINGDRILEIGSGGGFLKELYPFIITSDVTAINGVDMVINAEELPFADNSLDSIFAMHVIHHIPDVTKFFDEAVRVLKSGGGIVCVEPYWGQFAAFLYKNIHPEGFDKKAKNWRNINIKTPSDYNQALSYLLLKRDRKEFMSTYPELEIVYQRPFNCFRYIATGGLWLKPKLPLFMFKCLKYIEVVIQPLMPLIGIHHMFIIRKKDNISS